jgi:hypothetical protein
VCGHIHHACIAEFGNFRYVNTGDWVESCTAIGEHHDGRLEILRWTHAASVAAEHEHSDPDNSKIAAFNEAAE